MPHFSTDYVLGEPVLTCYLLPQMSADMQQQSEHQQQQQHHQDQQLPRKCYDCDDYLFIIYGLNLSHQVLSDCYCSLACSLAWFLLRSSFFTACRTRKDGDDDGKNKHLLLLLIQFPLAVVVLLPI